jgi:putative PIN family toxin of toxin-antitoxin system
VRAIVDTNIYVSSLLTGRRAGPVSEVLLAVSEDDLELKIPFEQITELRRVVTTKPVLKARISFEELERFIAVLTDRGEVLEPLGYEPPRVVRDRHDDDLIESAKRSEVSLLVSGDRDLHALPASPSGLTVVSPADLARFLRGELAQDS